ncbi:MAG: Fur family transcriptional regulator [Pseudomonadota bacterium]
MPRPTRNTDRVLDALRATDRALTAYELLDQLRPVGVSAPPTVYRALSRLVAKGEVHRIESLNAYTACRHNHAGNPVIAVCEHCHRVFELNPPEPLDDADFGAAAAGFEVRQTVVELHGWCGTCARETGAGEA